MTHLIFEANLLHNLNQLSLIPLPLAKYILPEWLSMLQRRSHNYSHHRLNMLLSRENVDIRSQQVMAGLQYFFRYLELLPRMGKKEALNKKQMNVLVKQNTILRQQLSELIVDLYQQFIDSKINPRIQGSQTADLKWSAIALRQTQKGQNPNKMYMKVQITSNQNGIIAHKTTNMSLVEYRMLAEQISKAESLLS